MSIFAGLVAIMSDPERGKGAALEAIFRAIPDLFFRMASDGTILDYRTGQAADLYVAPEEFLGRRMQEVLPEPIATCFHEGIRAALQTEAVITFDYRLCIMDRLQDFEVRLINLPDREVLAVIRNITEQKRAVEALREREATLCSFYDNAPVMMGVVEVEGEDILHISDNPATARFFHTTPEAMCSQWATQLGAPPAVVRQWIEYYRKSEATRQSVRFEYEHPVSGGTRWLSVNVGPIGATVSGRSRFCYVIEDITEKRHAEEQLRTALREKEVLLREIHHRVKNNLAVVASLLSLQAMSLPNDPVRDKLLECQMRVQVIARIHEMLYQSTRLSEVDFAEYVHRLAAELTHFYQPADRGIHLDVHVEAMTLDLETAIPCGLIVNELISNALKHAFPADRGGTIAVGLRTTESGELCLSVSDNGVGMPPNWEARENQSLGLRIVHVLSRQLGGRVEITRCGEQTIVQMHFPARTSAAGSSQV